MDTDVKMNRASIQRSMPKEAICLLCSEGDRTTYKILVMCMQVDPNLVLILDTMNMRGRQIFYAFMGHCNGFFPKFRALVTARDEAMIAYVNEKVPEWRASKPST